MTNEEIIKTTATTFFNDAVPNTPLPNGIGMLISDVLKLKDQQFKEYLEKKKKDIMNNPYNGHCLSNMNLLEEIINELFKEENK